jgi:hypothetical protein
MFVLHVKMDALRPRTCSSSSSTEHVSPLGQARAWLLSQRDVCEVKQDLESNTSFLLAYKVILPFAALHIPNGPQIAPTSVAIADFRSPTLSGLESSLHLTSTMHLPSKDSESSKVCLTGYCKWHSAMIHPPV